MNPKISVFVLASLLVAFSTHAQVPDIQPDQITKIQLAHNLDTPKTVVISLVSYLSGPFAKQVYKAIYEINQAEHLSGDKGPNAAINLVLLAIKEWDGSSSPEETINDFKESMAKELNLNKDNLPNVKILQLENLNTIPWMQDIAKPAFFTLKNSPAPVLGMVDLNWAGSGERLEFISALSKNLNLPVYDLFRGHKPGEADQGGNIDITPEGQLYVGDSMSKFFRQKLEALTQLKAIVIPTDWLLVGHVDEIVTYIPAKDGPVLVYADPIEYFNVIRKTKKSEFGDSAQPTLDSIARFLKPGRGTKQTLELDDFDMSKPVRMDVQADGALKYQDYEVKANLYAATQIRNAVEILQKSSRTPSRATGVPVVYVHDYNFGNVTPKEKDIYKDLRAFNPMPNLLSLRGHVIVSDTAYKKEFAARIGKIIGKDKIHFVSVSGLEHEKGSVHCATMLFRELK